MKQQYQALIKSIIDISEQCRHPEPVKLLAVSKMQPEERIRALFALGQKDFGENYYQEAQKKIANLSDLAITWHFIGAIQSNKAKFISQEFDWVQTIDRTKIAQLLHLHRPEGAKRLNVLVQVNVNDEESKAGVRFEEIEHLCEVISALPRLQLRGLMAIPRATLAPGEQALNFSRVTAYYQQLKPRFGFDTLSMGMSADYQQAIACGSTLIRVGRQLFGERKAK